MSNEYIPRIAMSIHAHPDDQEFTIGGTLAKWARAGCKIISVVITSGDSGSNDPAKDGDHKQELAELRERLANPKNRLRENLQLSEDVVLAVRIAPDAAPGPAHDGHAVLEHLFHGSSPLEGKKTFCHRARRGHREKR